MKLRLDLCISFFFTVASCKIQIAFLKTPCQGMPLVCQAQFGREVSSTLPKKGTSKTNWY